MKIAVFYNFPAGGAKRVVYEEVKSLSKKHSVDLFRLSTKKESFLNIDSFCRKTFVYDFKLESSLPLFLARLYKDFKNFVTYKYLQKKIAQDIDLGNYDIVLAHSDIYTEAPLLIRFLKTPYVYYDHEYLAIVYDKNLEFNEGVGLIKKCYENLTRKIRKYMDYNTTVKAKCIVTNSFFMQKFIKQVYGKNAYVCYPGVDTNIFKKYNNKQNKILFVGNKSKIDTFESVQEAIKIVNQKFKVRLEIIVKKDLIKNDYKLARKYSESLVTLCTSQIEAFGLKAIESLACQTPVIALRRGGYKEIIDDGQNGFLVEGNANKIAEKIIYLLQNSDVAEKMGKRGREIVLRKWKWEYHMKEIEKILIETAIK